MNHDGLSATRESIELRSTSVFDARGLRLILAINGGIFLVRAVRNLSEPTAFYLPPYTPAYAKDAVRVLGVP